MPSEIEKIDDPSLLGRMPYRSKAKAGALEPNNWNLLILALKGGSIPSVLGSS